MSHVTGHFPSLDATIAIGRDLKDLAPNVVVVDNVNRMTDFFREIKRRRVYRVALVYLIVAAGVVQIAARLFPSWDWPLRALRLVMMVLVVGLPISVLVAWILGRSSRAIPTEPTFSSKRISSLLARCGQLSDPVQYVADGLLGLSYVYSAFAIFVVFSGIGIALTERGAPLGKLLPIIGILGWPLAIWLLLTRGGRRRVIYLRAFRTDQRAYRLRSFLKAALGPKFLLSGIRPPARRGFWFFRAFAQLWMALRYAGSQHFNLEAHDRNWMARLLASYAHTDFVFIDVRDITVHVANEIRLSYLAMGAERCVFIVDPALPETEWVSRIHELLGCDPGSPLILHLLTYPGDASVQPEQFVRLTRSVIERVPKGLPLINEEEIAFVEARVASKDWVTHFWETDRGMRWCAIGLSAVLYFVLLIIASALDLGLSGVEGEFAHLFLNLCQLIILVLIGFVFWAIVFSYVMAWVRAWRQACFERRFRRPGEPSPFWRPAFSLVLMLTAAVAIGAGTVESLH